MPVEVRGSAGAPAISAPSVAASFASGLGEVSNDRAFAQREEVVVNGFLAEHISIHTCEYQRGYVAGIQLMQNAAELTGGDWRARTTCARCRPLYFSTSLRRSPAHEYLWGAMGMAGIPSGAVRYVRSLHARTSLWMGYAGRGAAVQRNDLRGVSGEPRDGPRPSPPLCPHTGGAGLVRACADGLGGDVRQRLPHRHASTDLRGRGEGSWTQASPWQGRRFRAPRCRLALRRPPLPVCVG